LVVYAVIVVLGYLLGSIPTSLLLLRAIGRADVRTQGSRSAGATNVLRLQGWRPALAVAVLDIAKGWCAAGLLPLLAEFVGQATPDWLAPAAGLAATLGHVWPVFAGFHGGKGVATASGVVLAVYPAALGVILVVFVAVALATRIVSLGSLAAALSLPLALWLQSLLTGQAPPAAVWGYSVLVTMFLVWTHRENIRQLRSGIEPRVGR
jgi:glycerol-3-phosphate acyltransferase PlsY